MEMERFTVSYYTDANPFPDGGAPVKRHVFGYAGALGCAVATTAREKQSAAIYDRDGRLMAVCQLNKDNTAVEVRQLPQMELKHPALEPKPEPAPKPPVTLVDTALINLEKRVKALEVHWRIENGS